MKHPFPSIPTIFAILFITASLAAAERAPVVLLWPNGAPGSEAKKDLPEIDLHKSYGSIAGIHNPSITAFLPATGRATGAGILVIPGGGHRELCVVHEGYNVGQWLADHGIAAFVLKHRLAKETNSTYRIEVESLADIQRALRLIRSRAEEWSVDPARLGAMGFSAGGELVNLVSGRNDDGNAAAPDPVDRFGCKIAFQGLIYPGRSGDILPRADSPPAFLACGFDDRQDIAEGLAEVYLRFKRAKVPAELHIYTGTGHGFGLRASNKGPSSEWPVRFREWLDERGFLQGKP
jgi:acetyl esterase/lipase